MPIHSYICKKCGAVFELLVNVTADTDKPKCEKCGSPEISRTFSNFSVNGPAAGSCENAFCGMDTNSHGCCPGCKIK